MCFIVCIDSGVVYNFSIFLWSDIFDKFPNVNSELSLNISKSNGSINGFEVVPVADKTQGQAAGLGRAAAVQGGICYIYEVVSTLWREIDSQP